MNTVDAIRSRRAVKHFDATHSMTEEEVIEAKIRFREMRQ